MGQLGATERERIEKAYLFNEDVVVPIRRILYSYTSSLLRPCEVSSSSILLLQQREQSQALTEECGEVVVEVTEGDRN